MCLLQLPRRKMKMTKITPMILTRRTMSRMACHEKSKKGAQRFIPPPPRLFRAMRGAVLQKMWRMATRVVAGVLGVVIIGPLVPVVRVGLGVFALRGMDWKRVVLRPAFPTITYGHLLRCIPSGRTGNLH